MHREMKTKQVHRPELSKESLDRFEDALLIIRTGKDKNGNCFNDIGMLNQAAWVGEHSGVLIEEIKRLRADRAAAKPAIKKALELYEKALDLWCSCNMPEEPCRYCGTIEKARSIGRTIVGDYTQY